MRIAIVVDTGIREISGDSAMIAALEFVRWAPMPLFSYLVVPDNADVDAITLPPRTVILRSTDASVGFFEKAVSYGEWTTRRFSQKQGCYPVDAVMVQSAAAAPVAEQAFGHWQRRWRPPVFVFELHPFDDEGFLVPPAPHQKVSGYYALRALGWALGYSFQNTGNDVKTIRRYCERFLSPALAQQAAEHALPVVLAVACAELDTILTETQRPNDKITVFYGGRLNKLKRADEILEQYVGIYATGHGSEVSVVTQTRPMKARMFLDHARMSVPPGFKMRFAVGREAYLREAALGHVFLYLNQMEAGNMAILEQLYLGLVGVLPHRPWAFELLGEDYPFLWRTKAEAYGMLQYAVDNWEEASSKIAYIRDRIRKNHDLPVARAKQWTFMCDKVQAFVESVEGPGRSIGEKNAQLLAESIRLLRMPCTLSQVMQAMDTISPGYVKAAARLGNHASKYEVYRWLVNHGLTDTCETADPIFTGTLAYD